jgi:hypothetical protein
VAGVLGTALVVAAPRIKRWWTVELVPVAQTVVEKARGRSATGRHEAPDDSATFTRATLRDFAARVDGALLDVRTGMARPGAHQNLVEVLLAASIIADRVRAHIGSGTDDPAQLREATAAIERLATPEVTDVVSRALSTGVPPLHEETVVIFARVFHVGDAEGGRPSALTHERVQEALHLRPVHLRIPPSAGDGTPPRRSDS